MLTRMSGAHIEGVDALQVSEVEAPRLAADLPGHDVRGIAVQIGYDDPRSGRGPSSGARATDPAATPGDHRRTSGEVDRRRRRARFERRRLIVLVMATTVGGRTRSPTSPAHTLPCDRMWVAHTSTTMKTVVALVR